MNRHEVKFERKPDNTTMHRAVCTCGWSWYGALEDCQRQSATHDMDWIAVDPTAPASVSA